MTEQAQIEQDKEIPVISGFVECPSQRAHLFTSKSAMLDWLKWSNVQVGSFRYGVHQETGKHVYELVYYTNEN